MMDSKCHHHRSSFMSTPSCNSVCIFLISHEELTLLQSHRQRVRWTELRKCTLSTLTWIQLSERCVEGKRRQERVERRGLEKKGLDWESSG